MKARSNSIVRNSAINLGANASGLIVALICVPIAFRALGTHRFGLLALLWSVLTYATLFDLGIGRSVARASSAALAHGRLGKVRTIVQRAVTLQFGIGVIAAVVLAFLAPWIAEILNVPDASTADFVLALRAVAASMPLLIVAQSQIGVLEACERFDLIAYIRTPLNIATYVIPTVGAVLQWSLAEIFFALLAVRLTGVLVLHLFYKQLVVAAPEEMTSGELRELLRFGGWLTISAVIIGIMLYADRFVLAAFGTLDDVAQYAAPYDLAAKLLVIPGSIAAVLFPNVSKGIATSQDAKALQGSRSTARIVTFLMLPICLLLILVADPLLHRWLGAQIDSRGVAAFQILVFASALHASSFMPVVFIEGLGRSDIIAKYHLFELPIYLVILALAVKAGGVIGAAWAWAIRSAWLSVWANWYVQHWQRRNRAEPARSLAVGT